MGISGLLTLLKSIQRPTELKKFAGETLAVDAYGWLHRGAVACAMDLALGKPTTKYVEFAMHQVRMVKHFGATPYLVFDGDFLPSKALTEASREKRRDDSKEAGKKLLNAGKRSEAYSEFQKAIDVTPEMARELIEELKKIGVPYVVAPYEADAQMVYLERHGYVGGIISEDSDLLVFGAKRLLTKLDQYGQCVEINRRDFAACREISLTGWTDAEFRQMAIFSGCDYLDGVKQMGLKTAYRMIRKHKTSEKVIRMLQFEGKHKISENYLASFKQAELTFLHQRVYCPEKQELVLLTPPTSGLDVEEMTFIGPRVEPELARAIAVGDVNPISKQPIMLPDYPGRRRSIPRGSKIPVPTSNVKKLPGKPIDQYFNGHRRIPMGEMDPNCFSVDSQRVAALTQNGLTPRIFPLPRPYLDDAAIATSSTAPLPSAAPRILRRRTEPIANLIGFDTLASDANGRRIASPATRNADEANLAGTPTSVRPPKKARLCEEDVSATDLDGELVPSERSKFFPPSIDKRAQTRKKRAACPMSDDSIEDALLSLPDYGYFGLSKPRSTRKSIQVFEDNPEAATETTEVIKATPTKPRADLDSSHDQETIEVPLSSPIRPMANGPNEPEVDRPEAALRSSLGKFAYTPHVASLSSSKDRTKMAFGLPTPTSSLASVGPAASMRKNPRPPPSSAETPMLTPLQRIGANALHRRKAPASPGTPREASGFRLPDKRAGRRSLPGQAPINPAFVPLPKVDFAEVEALNQPVGSEDQIIPDSDEENEPLSPKTGGGVGGIPGLNLTRFLYY